MGVNQRAKLTRVRGETAPFFVSVGIVPGFEEVAVVGEAVEHCGGHLGIAKDLDPPQRVAGGQFSTLFSTSTWSLLHAD